MSEPNFDIESAKFARHVLEAAKGSKSAKECAFKIDRSIQKIMREMYESGRHEGERIAFLKAARTCDFFPKVADLKDIFKKAFKELSECQPKPNSSI